MAVVFEGTAKPKVLEGPYIQLSLPPEERPAGWERGIAPSVLKEVEVCPTFLSDDVLTIGLPPRATQPSVARYVREVKHYRDASYGSHFGLYSGVNLLPVFGERMKTVPTVPRTHHHFGTGVNGGFEDVTLHPTVLELKVLANRANWIPSPSEASAKLVKLAKPAQRYPKEHQALFPFPNDPAGTHCPVPTDGPPLRWTPPEAKELVLPKSSLMWPTPFWYNGSLRRSSKPAGDPNDYNFCRLLKDREPTSVREDLQVDAIGHYIPGQIANEDYRCLEPEPKQEEPPATRTKQLYERRIIPYRPPNEHYQLDPWLGQDLRQLHRVGLAFKSDVCKNHRSLYPPGPQPDITRRRCDYPDIRLSVL